MALIAKEENEPLQSSDAKKGYERIFNFIPAISPYQIMLVLCALYPRIAAGAIQFAKIILEENGVDNNFGFCERTVESGNSKSQSVSLF